MEGIGETFKAISDMGFVAAFASCVLFIGFKWANKKLFSEENVKKLRETNDKIDRAENEASKEKIRKIQEYLRDRSGEIFEKGIDRVSVWINHNGMRVGKIHFIFYSLIAEQTIQCLKSLAETPFAMQRMPYYVFAEYEDRIVSGDTFVTDAETLNSTARAIARDTGTKSLLLKPIYALDGKRIDGIIFFCASRETLDNPPNVHHIVNDIRAMYVS